MKHYETHLSINFFFSMFLFLKLLEFLLKGGVMFEPMRIWNASYKKHRFLARVCLLRKKDKLWRLMQ